MRKLIPIWIFLLWAPLLFGAESIALVTITGETGKIGLTPKGGNCTLANAAHLRGEAKTFFLSASLPVTAEWRKLEFSFLPTRGGKITIALGGAEDGGTIAWDDLRLNGELVPNGDFEGHDPFYRGHFTYWWCMRDGDHASASGGRSGKFAIAVTAKDRAYLSVFVESGELYTLTVYARGDRGR